MLTTLEYLIECMPADLRLRWWQVVGIDLPQIDQAIEAGDFELASNLEAAYLEQHEKDVYRVTWPEHVLQREFNTDASYSRLEPAEVPEGAEVLKL